MLFGSAHTFMTIIDGAIEFTTDKMQFDDNQFTESFEQNLGEGEHSIYFIFDKGIITDGTNSPYIHLEYISIEGTDRGGGIRCLGCPEGFYSYKESHQCNPCEIGYESNVDHTECVKCAEGFY